MSADKAIEEYQIILLRNPSAKVFAPLAEAYRKMGLLQQALEICERGVKYNPDYPSGLVAYGKVLFEMKRYPDASTAFTQATELKTDNILAYKLNALSLIKMNRYADALKAYKAVLFLNPQDAQAKKFIDNWEYLEAPQFSTDTFEIEPEQESELLANSTPQHVANFVEALIVRNEITRAQTILTTSLEIWPDDPELVKQQHTINEFQKEESLESTRYVFQENQIKKDLLLRLLRRIELVKKVDQRRPNPFNT